VEQAFGMLVSKWRILREGLEFSVERDTRIIFLAMKLQNFCIERGENIVSRTLVEMDRSRAVAESDRWYQQCKEGELERLTREERSSTASNKSVSRKKDKLVDIIRRNGLSRPRPVSMNSI